jgi:hypothetical protein
MKAGNKATARPDAKDTELDGKYVVDRLGRMDLDGWELAEKVVSRFGSVTDSGSHILFTDLKNISFGVWDDGRWTVYEEREAQCRGREGLGLPNEDICPVGYIEDVIAQVFAGCPDEPLNACHYARFGIRDHTLQS